MREIIKEKLNNMEDLEQRRVLKNILNDVFENLTDHQQKMNKQLEERIFAEVEDQEEYYDIYTTIIARDKIELLDEFLYPMREEDREQETYDQEEILEHLSEGEPFPVTNVFFDRAYDKIEELKAQDNSFAGTVITENGQYSIKVKLEYNPEYIKEEEKLYQLFLENSIQWRTVNNPYIRKCFQLVITDCEDDLGEEDSFQEIKFDLGKHDDHKNVDYVPVWNVEPLGQKGEGFPLPAGDQIHYDHSISLQDLGLEHGYLIIPDDFNILSLKKRNQELILTSDKSDLGEWELVRVFQGEAPKYEDLEFELMGNSRTQTFINKFAEQNFRAIKTWGELKRVINSFQAAKKLELEDVTIQKELPEEKTTYDFNSFLEDEIRIDNIRRVMLLEFSSELDDPLGYDLLSFLVSEVQRYFPEYKCRGVIRK